MKKTTQKSTTVCVIIVFILLLTGFAHDGNAGGQGICWDVRVKRHVPCGWNPPSGGGGGSGVDPWSGMMMNLFNQFMTGFQQGMQQNQRPSPTAIFPDQQSNNMQKFLQDQQRIREDREKRHRHELNDAKKSLLRQMKGVNFDNTVVRPPLEVEPNSQDLFGIATLKPVPTAGENSLTSYQRANCGVYLMNLAMAADIHEAAYLSKEAAGMINGKQPEVQCPASPEEPPPVNGAPVPWEDAPKSLKEKAQFFSKLYGVASKQLDTYHSAQIDLQQVEAKIKTAKANLVVAKQNKAELEIKQKTKPKAVSPDALAEAMAALQAAEDALAGSEKFLVEKQRVITNLEKNLQETRKIAEKARQQPDNLNLLMEELKNKEPGSG